MTNLEDLISYTVVIVLSFVVSGTYSWLTAKSDQFSYPAKLRGIVIKMPWVAVISLPLFILEYFTAFSMPFYVGLAFVLIGLATVVLGLLAIIAALFHRQSRDRVTKPFENEHAQKGWGWVIAILTVLATIIAFIVTTVISIIKALKWADALVEPSKPASEESSPWNLYDHNNLHEEARRARGEDV